MWRGKVILQEQARKLRSQGRSVKEIARKLTVAQSSVSLWVRHVPLSTKQMNRLKQRELDGGISALRTYWKAYRKLHPLPPPKGPRWQSRTVETFFDIWSPEMAYILGYFAADGCMYQNKRGSCYVGFVSTDRELIEITRRLMGVTNAIEEYQSPKPNRKRRYALQVGSKILFKRLLKLGFTPNKSLKIKFPRIPDAFLSHFLRGYFDGDGCVSFGRYIRKERRQSVIFLLSVNYTCGNRDFLSSLQKRLIRVAHLGAGSLSGHPNAYHLSYSTRDARQLYQFMYPSTTVPCLGRKLAVFNKAFQFLDP